MNVPGWITNLKRPGSFWGAVVGWLCVGIGVLGIVLPIIPGLPFLFAGLFILSARYAWALFCLKWLQRQANKVSARTSQRGGRPEAFGASRRQPVETGDPNR
jgi:Putative transmembrane protein (PGPGW)